MDLHDIGRGAGPDGAVRYRQELGVRVGIAPATCKRGLHSLHEVGYTAHVVDSELRVSCEACVGEPHPDHCWRLTVQGPAPARAELDDAPYAGIVPNFVQRPVVPPA